MCNKAIVFGNFSNAYVKSANSVRLTIDKGQDKKAALNKSISNASFYLKTSTQTSVTSRIEERIFLDALFLSYFLNETIRNACGKLPDIFRLRFVPHALIIIYPHHHFW